MTTLSKLIATFFGLGYLPVAPGTFGALGGLLISYCLLVAGLDVVTIHYIHAFLIVIAYFCGVWACKNLVGVWGHDPSRVVIDETLGFWISILFLPADLYVWLTGFILFRFFDILKPLGIKNIDRLESSHAVMLDDVLAGVYANITLHVFLFSGLLNTGV